MHLMLSLFLELMHLMILETNPHISMSPTLVLELAEHQEHTYIKSISKHLAPLIQVIYIYSNSTIEGLNNILVSIKHI